MSAQSAANTAYLSRTTGFTDEQPTTIACWFRFSVLTAGVWYTIWDHGGGVFQPQLSRSADTGSVELSAGGSTALIVSPVINTWYFVASVFNGTSTPATNYVGTAGGALSTITNGANFDGWGGTVMTIYNEVDHDQTLNGQMVSLKIWNGTGGALSADEVANEYLKFQPSKTTALYCALPLLGVTNAGVDMSGNGHDFTAAGTLTTQRTMPYIPWLGEP